MEDTVRKASIKIHYTSTEQFEFARKTYQSDPWAVCMRTQLNLEDIIFQAHVEIEIQDLEQIIVVNIEAGEPFDLDAAEARVREIFVD